LNNLEKKTDTELGAHSVERRKRNSKLLYSWQSNGTVPTRTEKQGRIEEGERGGLIQHLLALLEWMEHYI